MKLDPKTKFELFQKNNNFCSVPWNLFYIDTDGQVEICTKSNKASQCNINNVDIEEILLNPIRLDIKTKMLADQPVNSCNSCHQLENQGNGTNSYQYLRNMYNKNFVGQDIEYTDVTQFIFSALDLHWSSICDLKSQMSSTTTKSKSAQRTQVSAPNSFSKTSTLKLVSDSAEFLTPFSPTPPKSKAVRLSPSITRETTFSSVTTDSFSTKTSIKLTSKKSAPDSA